MTESMIFSWDFLIYPLAAFIYIELLRWMDKRLAGSRRVSLEERLSNYARNQGVSEYEVFHRASATWAVGKYQVDKDFNTYLRTLILPYYVRDFVRKLNNDSG
jgi:hypothetical protein